MASWICASISELGAEVVPSRLRIGSFFTEPRAIATREAHTALTHHNLRAFCTRATYINSFEFQVEKGGAWFNPLGNYHAQYGGPVIRHQQITSIRWKRNDVTTTLTHRWLSGYQDQNLQSAPFNVAPFNQNKVGDYAIFNLSATYSGFKSFVVQAGILNLFDTDPPFTNQISRFQARGYDDRFHNPLGRTFLVSLRYEL